MLIFNGVLIGYGAYWINRYMNYSFLGADVNIFKYMQIFAFLNALACMLNGHYTNQQVLFIFMFLIKWM